MAKLEYLRSYTQHQPTQVRLAEHRSDSGVDLDQNTIYKDPPAINNPMQNDLNETNQSQLLQISQHMLCYDAASSIIRNNSQTTSNSQFSNHTSPSSVRSPSPPLFDRKRKLRRTLSDEDFTLIAGRQIRRPRLGGASEVKRRHSQSLGFAATGKKLMGEHDPENREILRLRQEELLEFDYIATRLNAQRAKSGQAPTLTANAIYSRYKRNGPIIAASEGREFLPTHLDKKPNGKPISFRTTVPIKGFDEREDQLLAQAVADIDKCKWELVAHRVQELGGKEHDSNMCAMRYSHL
ncbi:uncharacterized protein KY384_007465 [Bacidia gigantensis]|uniref:uncharacterized protein n=1 Tax=Bacidia gigantensis TaxID=2732470 RepID=UPI001D04F934|nr:uncharacterized protein KY384_007465 [Bacidia gigantensis]KAG8528547.1 hypothetical protein KY384_007465 [Bacidia gigantensis]